MRNLTAKDLTTPKLKRVDLENGHVLVRSLTVLETLQLHKCFGDKGSTEDVSFNAALLGYCICDEAGQRLFDGPANDLPQAIAVKLSAVALEMSGLGVEKKD